MPKARREYDVLYDCHNRCSCLFCIPAFFKKKCNRRTQNYCRNDAKLEGGFIIYYYANNPNCQYFCYEEWRTFKRYASIRGVWVHICAVAIMVLLVGKINKKQYCRNIIDINRNYNFLCISCHINRRYH